VNTELASFHAYIYGQVQGVFFRSYLAKNARELGLVGFVRNLSNGSVEVLAEGDKKQLEKLIEFMKVGPSAARVDEYKITWSRPGGDYLQFHVF
jgi:acylphosphatase